MTQAHQSQQALAACACGMYPQQPVGGSSLHVSQHGSSHVAVTPRGLLAEISDASSMLNESHELITELESRLSCILIDTSSPPTAAREPRQGPSMAVSGLLAHQQGLVGLNERLKLLIGRINL